MSLFGWASRRFVKLTDPIGLSFGQTGAAGKIVTPDTALQLSTAWSCVRLLSETVGTLPLNVFAREGERRELARDEPLYDLLHNSPNADQTAAEFWEAVVACLCLWGNAYAEKGVMGGRLASLAMLRPDLMKVFRDEDGRRKYRYSDPLAGRQRVMDEDEIFHVRGFGAGGDEGLSPISYARQVMSTALAADEAAAKTFANGLQISGFIQEAAGTRSSPDQRDEFIGRLDKFTGSDRVGKWLPLPAGFEMKPLNMNPADAQLLTTREFHVEEICRFYRVPPFMVGHTAKSTSWGTGLEQQTIGFLTYSLAPYLTRIEKACGKQLIPAGDRARLFVEFNLDGLLRADTTARSALYSAFAQNGIMDRNEIRRKENLPEREGADELTVQSNLVPLAQLGSGDAVVQARAALRALLGVQDAEYTEVRQIERKPENVEA